MVLLLLLQDSFLHWKFAVAPCAAFGFVVHAWDHLGSRSFFEPLNVSGVAWRGRRLKTASNRREEGGEKEG